MEPQVTDQEYIQQENQNPQEEIEGGEDYEIYERNSFEEEQGSRFRGSGSEFKSKLLISKMATKEIENEAKTLANRIALLENEERKVLKKIEETKQKALNIMKIKSRNKEHNQSKTKLKMKRRKELESKREQIRNKKASLRNKVKETKQRTISSSHAKAREIKENLKKLKERYKIQKKEEQLQNIQQVNNIRTFEKEVEIKKRQQKERIMKMAKDRYNNQIHHQEKVRDKLENEITRLENRERELIKRLKNTQQFHQLAVDDLDRIVNDQQPLSIQVETQEENQ